MIFKQVSTSHSCFSSDCTLLHNWGKETVCVSRLKVVFFFSNNLRLLNALCSKSCFGNLFSFFQVLIQGRALCLLSQVCLLGERTVPSIPAEGRLQSFSQGYVHLSDSIMPQMINDPRQSCPWRLKRCAGGEQSASSLGNLMELNEPLYHRALGLVLPAHITHVLGSD